MGCTTSRDSSNIIGISAAAAFDQHNTTKDPQSLHRHYRPFNHSLSLPPLPVHHLPQNKGDSYHVVALTSSTLGSLVIDPLTDHQLKSPQFGTQGDKEVEEEEDLPSPESIDARELMHGLEDDDDNVSPNRISSASERRKKSVTRSATFSVNNGVKNHDSKPLWMHLNEESVEDSEIVFSSFQRAAVMQQPWPASIKDSGQIKAEIFVPPSIPSSKILPIEKMTEDAAIPIPITLKEVCEGKIVVYLTSLRGIRQTYEDCCAVRSIFRGLKVLVDERDVSMDSAYRKELQTVFGGRHVTLPRVFADGRYLGGAEEIKNLNETGELAKLLRDFPMQDSLEICEVCADARFVLCENCHGSRKVYEDDEEGGIIRRCDECNENGLIRCPLCCY